MNDIGVYGLSVIRKFFGRAAVINDNDLYPIILTLAFYWKSSNGIVCGHDMASDILDACQNFGMRQVLVINPPANLIFPANFHPVYYDFSVLVNLSNRFWENGPCRKIVMLRTDRKIVPPPEVEVIDLEEYPSVDLGRAYGERFFAASADTGFWVTDDFVGLGFYDFFRSHGIDLNASKRLLVNSSPSRLLTEELGIATIGFCPMRIGEAASSYFSRMLKGQDANFSPLVIPATANTPAERRIEESGASK